MMKLQKNSILKKFKNFDEFLLSDMSESKGYCDADIEIVDNKIMKLKIADNIKGEEYRFVIKSSDKRKKKYVISAQEIRNEIIVNFTDIEKEILAKNVTWLCYIGINCKEGFYFGRVRNIGAPNFEREVGGRTEKLFWKDMDRYLESVYSYSENDITYNLIPFFNEKRNTLSIQLYKQSLAKQLQQNRYPWKIKNENEGKIYPFKISVVMSVFNVENYIREAIDSVLEQDIGFEKNIQLILVNDGSKDNSGKICDEYCKKYPNNIIVIHKENGGLSSARNAGKQMATGKYVNFFDPDDILDLNAFSTAYDFFEEHYNETDVVCIPIIHFEAINGPYWQNYKFDKGSRIIDLKKEYTVSNMNSAASFVKNELVSLYEFDTRLPLAEDAKWMLQVMLHKETVGVVCGTTYWYRRRDDGNLSQVQSGSLKKSYYFEYFQWFVEWIKTYCIKERGYIPLFVQNTVMMDLQWRFRMEELPQGVLSDDEKNQYINNLHNALQGIDDTVIMKQRKMFVEHFSQVLSLKYGMKPEIRYVNDDATLYIGNTVIREYSSMVTNIEFIKIENKTLYIEGYSIAVGAGENDEIFTIVKLGNRYYECEKVNRNVDKENFIGVMCRGIPFVCKILLDDYVFDKNIEFYLSINSHPIKKRRIVYGKFSPINNVYKNQYYCKDGVVLKRNGCNISIERCDSKEKWMEYENNFINELKRCRIPDIEHIISRRYKAILSRIYKDYRKPIWIIADRNEMADDNGEAFFKFMSEKKEKNINYFFAIKRESKYWNELQKIGKVIPMYTDEYKDLFLQSDYFICSQFDDFLFRPLKDEIELYRDLMNDNKFVFLQHGITKDDMSSLLNRYKKDMSGFVTAAKPEYNSILEGNYGYTKKQVWLTGFPRYDLLYDQKDKLITIMPTWRKYLVKKYDQETSIWSLQNDFENSEYCIFYRKLLNSSKLLEAADEFGYKILFLQHPTMLVHMDKFKPDSRILIPEGNWHYRDIFAKSALVLTDYSSTVFDFAYLRKPIIYTHFDKEQFFGKHYQHGYFSYEDNGFGEVEYTLEDTIQRLIEYMENGCEMKKMYRQRCDEFFAYNDKNNCRRVYEAILNLDVK